MDPILKMILLFLSTQEAQAMPCASDNRPIGCEIPYSMDQPSCWPGPSDGCGPISRDAMTVAPADPTHTYGYGYDYGFGLCSRRSDNDYGWHARDPLAWAIPACRARNGPERYANGLFQKCSRICDMMLHTECVGFQIQGFWCTFYVHQATLVRYVDLTAEGFDYWGCQEQSSVAPADMEPSLLAGTFLEQIAHHKGHCWRRLPPPSAAVSQSVGFRFSKHGISITYPVTTTDVTALAATPAVSVRTSDHTQIHDSLSFFPAAEQNVPGINAHIFNGMAKMEASHPQTPGANPNFNFWTEFEEVVKAQVLRENGALTKDIMDVHPLFDANETMEVSAQRVKSDFPIHFPTEQIKRFLGTGGLTLDKNIVNACNAGREFVNGPVSLGEVIGWAVRTVSPAAFLTKWYVGRARPEEVAYNISLDSQAGIPSKLGAQPHLTTLIDDMNLANAYDFTAYKDVGSPVHPSFPAMHSAASSVSTYLDIIANLTDAQRYEVRLLDYSIAYFRTLAGVHYESDNRAGLRLGQYIIQKKLPAYLADRFSCDETSAGNIASYVVNKIDTLNNNPATQLNWNDWVPNHWINPVNHPYFSSRRLLVV